MTSRIYRCGALALTLAASCMQVRTNQAPGTNLAQYRTFSFWRGANTDTTNVSTSQFANSIAGQTIRDEIARKLRMKGLTEVNNPQSADLLVAYHAGVRQRVAYSYGPEMYGPGWGWGWGWGAGVYPTVYNEGTIIVDFLDPHARKIVWRGDVSAVVDDPANPDPTKVSRAVDKLLKKYPRLATTNAPAAM